MAVALARLSGLSLTDAGDTSAAFSFRQIARLAACGNGRVDGPAYLHRAVAACIGWGAHPQ
jgi:hypothetical protein